MVLSVEVSFQHSYEGMGLGGLNATDVRRDRIPLVNMLYMHISACR